MDSSRARRHTEGGSHGGNLEGLIRDYNDRKEEAQLGTMRSRSAPIAPLMEGGV